MKPIRECKPVNTWLKEILLDAEKAVEGRILYF
jgi:hypothetical protein